MSDQLFEQLQQLTEELARSEDADALYEVRVRYLGKKGSITALKRQMGKLAPEDRKAFGQAFNAVKVEAERAIETRRDALVSAAREADLARHEDLSMPGAHERELGTLHPITQTRRALEDIFARMGFAVKEGPHIEDERYNFDKLNFQPGHPARDMQDTFFVRPRLDARLVLRTHT